MKLQKLPVQKNRTRKMKNRCNCEPQQCLAISYLKLTKVGYLKLVVCWNSTCCSAEAEARMDGTASCSTARGTKTAKGAVLGRWKACGWHDFDGFCQKRNEDGCNVQILDIYGKVKESMWNFTLQYIGKVWNSWLPIRGSGSWHHVPQHISTAKFQKRRCGFSSVCLHMF